MLGSIAHLVAIGLLTSFQFDIGAGGFLGETFSAASFFEDLHTAYDKGFASGGAISRVCEEFQRMGIADVDGALSKTCRLPKQRSESMTMAPRL